MFGDTQDCVRRARGGVSQCRCAPSLVQDPFGRGIAEGLVVNEFGSRQAERCAADLVLPADPFGDSQII